MVRKDSRVAVAGANGETGGSGTWNLHFGVSHSMEWKETEVPSYPLHVKGEESQTNGSDPLRGDPITVAQIQCDGGMGALPKPRCPFPGDPRRRNRWDPTAESPFWYLTVSAESVTGSESVCSAPSRLQLSMPPPLHHAGFVAIRTSDKPRHMIFAILPSGDRTIYRDDSAEVP